jgi:hypothetical protein
VRPDGRRQDVSIDQRGDQLFGRGLDDLRQDPARRPPPERQDRLDASRNAADIYLPLSSGYLIVLILYL